MFHLSEQYLIIHKKYLFLCENFFFTSKIFIYLKKYLYIWWKIFEAELKPTWILSAGLLLGVVESPAAAQVPAPAVLVAAHQAGVARCVQRSVPTADSHIAFVIFSSLSNIFQPGSHPHHGVCAVLPLRPGELPHVQAAAVAQPAMEIKISYQIFLCAVNIFCLPYLPLMLSVLWATGWRWKLSGSLSFTKMLRLRSSRFQACRTW